MITFRLCKSQSIYIYITNITTSLYCRYIDDIFVICAPNELLKLKDEMIMISGLNFTVEESVESKLPFLNVMIEKSNGTIKTSVYRKPTDNQMCLNGDSECPDRYKQSVIKGFLYRARNLCSEKSEMMLEISRSKQILVNNGYSNKMIDTEIKMFFRKNIPTTAADTQTTTTTHRTTVTPPPPPPPPTKTTTTTVTSTTPNESTPSTTAEQTQSSDVQPTVATPSEVPSSSSPVGVTHKIFYRNFMNPNYKKDEILLRRIIKDNVTMKDRRDGIQLILYYRSTKTRHLIMKNNLTPRVRDLARTNLIYDFHCAIDECARQQNRSERQYSGLTTCTISRRLTLHLQNGAIKIHCEEKHGRKPTRKEIVEMTKARYYESDIQRLETLEALIIRFEEPVINRQDTGKKKILKLYGYS